MLMRSIRDRRVPAILCLLAFFGHRVLADKAAEERMLKDITVLASDEFEGRGVTTKGIDKAADYVAHSFEKSGLTPAGKDGSYFQPFTMAGSKKIGPGRLQLVGPQEKELDLKEGQHFQTFGMSHPGKASGSLVFAGYGITTKDKEKIDYDDYGDIDVAGKIVVVLRDVPRADSKPASPHEDQPSKKEKTGGKLPRDYGTFTFKMQNALKHKAAAVLFVNDHDVARDSDDLLDFSYVATAPSPAALPALVMQRELLDQMLRSSADVSLKDVEKDIDRDHSPRSRPLQGWSANLEANVKRGTIDVKNVVGILEGKGPLAKETVVIGAHYDHLGYGGPGSLAEKKKPAIHHGADDNGSGTATLLELARRFGAMKERQGRRLVFIAFSAEESGLFGSEHYCKNPTFPLKDTVAMINLDMVGRLQKDDGKDGWAKMLSLMTPVLDTTFPILPLAHAAEGIPKDFLVPKEKLIVHGTGTAKGFHKLIDSTNEKYGFRLRKMPGGMGPSDHQSFYLKKVPVFFFFTGEHADYHKPSDTVEKINVTGMCKVADMVQEVVTHLAQVAERPEYVKVKETRPRGPEGRIPRIGIRPDYGDEGEGVRLSGVVEDGPAHKAGLKEGDRIISIGGKPVQNLEGYMSLIAGNKEGEPLELGVLRGDKKIEVKVVPE